MNIVLKKETVITCIVSLFLLSFIIFIGNVATLRKVSQAQKELHDLKITYDDKKKELDQKIVNYDNQYDFTKIKNDMEKKGMKIADNIIFFEIGE